MLEERLLRVVVGDGEPAPPDQSDEALAGEEIGVIGRVQREGGVAVARSGQLVEGQSGPCERLSSSGVQNTATPPGRRSSPTLRMQ